MQQRACFRPTLLSHISQDIAPVSTLAPLRTADTCPADPASIPPGTGQHCTEGKPRTRLGGCCLQQARSAGANTRGCTGHTPRIAQPKPGWTACRNYAGILQQRIADKPFSSAYVPGPQGRQVSRPLTSACHSPSSHSSQKVDAKLFWNCPVEQSLHVLCPCMSWKVPVGQSKHALLPVTCAYFPAGHFVHVMLALLAAYSPKAHWTHAVLPVPDAYVPVAHWTHAVPPVPDAYVPVAHLTHVVLPVPDAYVPVAHCVHVVAPSAGAYLPAAHGVPLVIPVELTNWPAVAGVQEDALGKGAYVPAAQSWQTLP
eukprot:101959-Rhodomonas_salina.2